MNIRFFFNVKVLNFCCKYECIITIYCIIVVTDSKKVSSLMAVYYATNEVWYSNLGATEQKKKWHIFPLVLDKLALLLP